MTPTEEGEDAEAELSGFPAGARWRELIPLDDAVPEEEVGNLRAPTVPNGEESIPKFNFGETFDREPFVELCEVFKEENGKLCKDRRGRQLMETVVREEGRAKKDWLEKNGLTMSSSPEEWIRPLLPDKKKPSDPKHVVSIANWCTYSNTKAMMMNAGQKGGVYPEFTPFSPQEIKHFLGLYLLNGLNPSPQLKMKFKPQHEDPINGSDLCHQVFGKNAEKRHKHFKAFFSCQDPMLPTPSRKTHPNHKVDNFLGHVNRVSMDAWDIGRHVSCDEQTIGFQGQHQDKQRINYKKEGDGFQADCICEKGFTYTFYYRNVSAPKKYLKRKCSPLHSRVLFMFDQLPCKNVIVGLDNLYISARFCREALIGKNKVMVHGVCRKEGRGIPPCVLQKEVKRAEQAAVRGKTKAAVLEGDPDCTDLVAFSVYDTKPVHFLSTACTTLQWKEITKKVYDKDAGMNVAMKFLCTELQDDYNHMMNHVDRADQLRGSYRVDKWIRNRKWWWSMWLWGLETLLVNAYVLYKETHLKAWKTPSKKLLTHYDFRRDIILTWLTGRSTIVRQPEIGTKRKRDGSNFSLLTSSTNSSAPKHKKAPTVSEASLDPQTGALLRRLDDDYVHYPALSSAKQPCCSLCRLLTPNKNVRTYAMVVVCDICRVHLCIRCFRPFHTIASVKQLKSHVMSITIDENSQNS